jgi:xylose isomerase
MENLSPTGAPFMSAYTPDKSHRFAFGLWTIMNTGGDPFGQPTRQPFSGLEVITELGRRNVWAFEMHAEDLVPADASASRRDKIIAEARKRMTDEDICCVNCGADVFSHPVFKDGALTNTNAEIRQFALQRYMNALDIGHELGCNLCDLWWGRDGAEVDAAKDPIEAIKWLREGLNYLQEYIDKQGYEGYRLAIEPKPNEPRGDLYMPTSGHALALISSLYKPANCGLVIELAHSWMAGLNPAHDIAQALEAGKLFGCHFNGQKPLRFDQDLRFGSEGIKEAFFVVKMIEESGWHGPRTFDAHAYRTSDKDEVWDFVEGCMRSYLILKEKVEQFRNDSEIQGLLKDLQANAEAPLPTHEEIAGLVFDANTLAERKLHHDKLDQLTMELLLGVR